MPAVSPIVHARSAQVGIGERESRRGWGQQLVVRGQLHSPMVKLVMRVAHVAPIRARCFNSKRTSFHVALELEHVESVDLRSEVRKADAVLPVFARAGQRSDTLKRVARRGRCRLLFLLGVQHISCQLKSRAPLGRFARDFFISVGTDTPPSRPSGQRALPAVPEPGAAHPHHTYEATVPSSRQTAPPAAAHAARTCRPRAPTRSSASRSRRCWRCRPAPEQR